MKKNAYQILVLLIFAIMLTACPYSSEVPIDEPSEDVDSKLFGKWVKVSDTNPDNSDFYEFTKHTEKKYKINENTQFESSISIPLAGIMVRMPWANDPTDGEHGVLVSTYRMGTKFFLPNEYQRINLNFSYEKKLKKNWGIGMVYSLYWLHYNKFRHVSAYSNSFSILLSKTLKN